MLTSFDQPHRHVPSCCKPLPMRTWVTAQPPTEDARDLTEAKSGHITPPLKFFRTPVTLRKQQVYKVLLGLAWASSLSSSPVSLPLIPSPSSAKCVLLPFLKYSRTAIPLRLSGLLSSTYPQASSDLQERPLPTPHYLI